MAGSPRRCNSFILGVAFASITWTVSLVLYSNLTEHSNTSPAPDSQHSSPPPLHLTFDKHQVHKKLFPSFRMRDNLIDPAETKWIGGKSAYIKGDPMTPSAALLSNLQPKKFEDELGMVRSLEDQRQRDEGYKNHAFNVLVSHKLGYHRDIPDTRHPLCREQHYPSELPVASVIICFFNEDLPTLLRSVHSVLDHTPAHLLQEILLVDDHSDLDDLHNSLLNYINLHLSSKVFLSKTPRREGLIRARMYGANQATGDVLVFLDSHVEVNQDWMEPLLFRISVNPHAVVTPVIDIINADTFQYSSSPLVRGGFNWGLHFKWENLPEGQLATDADFIRPIRSPTMAGGLFAMNRTYFKSMGSYDPGMNIWGGENLELSFRVWMCGGSLEILPCSRVGHVFRRRRPYGSPDGEDTMTRNSLRVAHVWMDEYKDYFFRVRPDARSVSFGDVSDRIRLRKQLGCRPFSWYMKNVYPELALPQAESNKARLQQKWQAMGSKNNKFQPWHLRHRNYLSQYQIRLSGTTLCVQSEKDGKTKGALFSLQPCMKNKVQVWWETDRHELVLAQLLCLDANDKLPRLAKCHEMGGSQDWQHHNEVETPIYNMAAGTCLGVQNVTVGAQLTMELCTKLQDIKWDLVKSK